MIACVAGGFLVCFSAQCVSDFLFCPWFSFYVAVSLTLWITNEKTHKENASYTDYNNDNNKQPTENK